MCYLRIERSIKDDKIVYVKPKNADVLLFITRKAFGVSLSHIILDCQFDALKISLFFATIA